jgi:1-acyl-sn-glycerol-3-phosphate acyltransferase
MEELELPPIGPMSAYHRWVRIPISKFFAWILFTLLGPLVSHHRWRIPRKGGLIVLSNHQSDLDPILVHLTSTRPIHFLGKSELFETKTLRKWMIRYYSFPVKRGEPDRASIRRAVALAKAGEVVGIFPEGELSETGDILPLKPGVALIIRMAGVPAICVGVRNARR